MSVVKDKPGGRGGEKVCEKFCMSLLIQYLEPRERKCEGLKTFGYIILWRDSITFFLEIKTSAQGLGFKTTEEGNRTEQNRTGRDGTPRFTEVHWHCGDWSSSSSVHSLALSLGG